MKSAENPRGVLSEHELWGAVSIIFIAIFFDFEPTKSFPLRHAGKAFSQMLGKLIEADVKLTGATGLVSGLVDGWRENQNALKSYGVHMVRKLLESGLSHYEIAWSQILPTAVAMIPNQSQVFTQLLDFYLGPKGAAHWPTIVDLAKTDDQAAFDALMHYAMEGIRLNGTFGAYRLSTVEADIPDGENGTVHVVPGDRVFSSFVGANRDPSRFPDPDAVKLDRPLDKYIHYGMGDHTCLGRDASRVALTAMLKTVARLPNLRRAPGPQGQLKTVPRPGGFYVYMTENHGSYFPFPTSERFETTFGNAGRDADCSICSMEASIRRRASRGEGIVMQQDAAKLRMIYLESRLGASWICYNILGDYSSPLASLLPTFNDDSSLTEYRASVTPR